MYLVLFTCKNSFFGFDTAENEPPKGSKKMYALKDPIGDMTGRSLSFPFLLTDSRREQVSLAAKAGVPRYAKALRDITQGSRKTLDEVETVALAGQIVRFSVGGFVEASSVMNIVNFRLNTK